MLEFLTKNARKQSPRTGRNYLSLAMDDESMLGPAEDVHPA